MKPLQGFTLIEMVVFIVVIAILGTTIMIAFVNALQGVPSLSNNIIANKTAEQCMEWYIGQRRLNGYTSIATGTTVPTYCTALPGYTVAVNVASTTINTDTNYLLITVTVSGLGDASLSTIVASY